MLLLIDNYDSFTYNLYQYFSEFCEVEVIRNDDTFLLNGRLTQYEAIILSPGPGKPSEAGYTKKVIEAYFDKLPFLGICLGHQALAEFFGGKVSHAREIKHGKVSLVAHDKNYLFKNLDSPTPVMRYHSLMVLKENFPEVLEICAESIDDGSIQGFYHKSLPIFGVQFHPESIGTKAGKQMILNFLKIIAKKSKINV